MTTVKKLPNGNYVITKRNRHNTKYSRDFRACACGKITQSINLGNLYVPKEMFGKKLRFKVEVMED